MERHLSSGVATIVALMSAHRAASGREGMPTRFCQEEVIRIEAYLLADETPKAAIPPGRVAFPE